ncbi:hypothetical protein BJX63DRAFT_148462 [Aspergillus granulosus]|uniref:Uncharacterized protein n=1 Tax=Aspergillus granulosus TaxID=176169 RepID=A0ABR4HKY5_9EURO
MAWVTCKTDIDLLGSEGRCQASILEDQNWGLKLERDQRCVYSHDWLTRELETTIGMTIDDGWYFGGPKAMEPSTLASGPMSGLLQCWVGFFSPTCRPPLASVKHEGAGLLDCLVHPHSLTERGPNFRIAISNRSFESGGNDEDGSNGQPQQVEPPTV